MRNSRMVLLIAALLAAGLAQAQGQPAAGCGKIVCWKDKSGKVVGCGDKVPPEYQDNASQTFNRQGVSVKQSDPALTPEQKRAQQAELERKKADDLANAELKRRDRALLDTFSNEKEIDLKRNRDIQLLESNIETLQSNLKNANDRQADSRSRIEQATKKNQPVPPNVQEEFDRIEGDKAKIQKQVNQKRTQIAELNLKYDEMKKRFRELKGTAAAPQAAAPQAAAPAAPAASPAPAKK